MKNISFNVHENKYIIRKQLNKKVHYFGSYSTLKEAEDKLNDLKKNGWEGKDKDNKYFYRYIHLNPPNYSKKYYIRKQDKDKKYIVNESYDDLREALSDRDFFEEHNWDINSITDNYCFKMNNKYSSMDLPSFPEN